MLILGFCEPTAIAPKPTPGERVGLIMDLPEELVPAPTPGAAESSEVGGVCAALRQGLGNDANDSMSGVGSLLPPPTSLLAKTLLNPPGEGLFVVSLTTVDTVTDTLRLRLIGDVTTGPSTRSCLSCIARLSCSD
jgi:hypothetical protein